MNRPPRPPSSRLLDASSLRFIVISGVAKALGGLAFLAIMPLVGYSLEETRTAVFLYESMMQLVFVYPSRRVNVTPQPNALVHVAVGVGLLLQVLTIVFPPLRVLLGLAPIELPLFGVVAAAVLLTWAIAEGVGVGMPQNGPKTGK